MAAELTIPKDLVTGLPHPILIYDAPSHITNTNINFDHTFFPSTSPELNETLGGCATRMSRGQDLPIWLHNKKHAIYKAAILPETERECFETTVKACAGLVSRWAIDLRIQDEDKLVHMDDETFEYVTHKSRMHMERAWYDRPASHRRSTIGKFFLAYAVDQDLSHISELVIEEFLETSDMRRKLELGNLMLREALDVSIAPVLPLHQELKKAGLVQAGKPNPRVMLRKFIDKGQMKASHELLGDRLRAVA